MYIYVYIYIYTYIYVYIYVYIYIYVYWGLKSPTQWAPNESHWGPEVLQLGCSPLRYAFKGPPHTPGAQKRQPLRSAFKGPPPARDSTPQRAICRPRAPLSSPPSRAICIIGHEHGRQCTQVRLRGPSFRAPPTFTNNPQSPQVSQSTKTHTQPTHTTTTHTHAAGKLPQGTHDPSKSYTPRTTPNPAQTRAGRAHPRRREVGSDPRD